MTKEIFSITRCHPRLCYTSYVFLQDQTRDEVNRFYFPCWRLRGSFSSAGALQISYFKILPWHLNKMVAGHEEKSGRQLSNNHNSQILEWFTYFTGYGEISQYKSLPCQIGIFFFSYFELPLPKLHLYQIRILLLQWFWRIVIK